MSENRKNIWISLGASVTGASHTRKEPPIPNQDAYKEQRGELHQIEEKVNDKTEIKIKITPTVVAVSDGHGSEKYIRSDCGSLFAVDTICLLATSMFRDLPNPEIRIRVSEIDTVAEQIKVQFVNMWKNGVDNHSKSHQLNEVELLFLEKKFAEGKLSEEVCTTIKKDFEIVSNIEDVKNNPPSRVAYGCTFLAAIAYEDVVLILQHGDGDIIGLYPNGEIKELIAPNPKNFANETSSLCRVKNPAEIQHAVLVGTEIPILITLSTDGVKNSFNDLNSDIEKFYNIPVVLKNSLFKNSCDTKIVATELSSLLTKMATHGSGDDVTLGVLFDESKIQAEVEQSAQTASVQESEPIVVESDVKDNSNNIDAKIGEDEM